MNERIYFLLPLILVTGILIGFSLNASAQETAFIPNWVKNTAKYWVNGDVGDADFIKAIQWMVTNGIIVLPNNSPSTNGNQQTSSTTITNNPLSALLPTADRLGPIWKSFDQKSTSKFADVVPSTPTYDRLGHIISTSEGQPTFTIEQTFQKASTPLTVTTFTVYMATFKTSTVGLSHIDVEKTRTLFSKMIDDYKKLHGEAKSEGFLPMPSNTDTTCTLFSVDTIHSTTRTSIGSSTSSTTNTQYVPSDMFCQKMTYLFMIHFIGTDTGMKDDVNEFTNLILKNIT